MKQFAIVEKKLQSLLEEVEPHLPRSAMMYNVVKLKQNLVENPSDKLGIKIFAFSSEGLVALITIKGIPQTIVVIFNPTAPTSQFLECLQNFMDWSIPHQFEGVETTVAKYIENNCGISGRLELHDPIELHYMPIEKALRLLPAATPKNADLNLRVGQLGPKDALEIDSVWPASCPGSLEMLSSSIELVGSGGVRILVVKINENDDEQDSNETELVSWAVGLPFGSIHALYTKPQYGGRGLAKMTMQSVSKAVAEIGRIPVVQIYKSNDASVHLNSSIGYTYSHDINLMHYYPK